MTSPLTHEERVAMKASLDAADERVGVAEAEARSTRASLDALKLDHEQVLSDLGVARGKIASLEADLDKATKPSTPLPAKPSGAK